MTDVQLPISFKLRSPQMIRTSVSVLLVFSQSLDPIEGSTNQWISPRICSHPRNVQASSKDDVTLDCIRSSFHFLEDRRITHNCCSIPKFTTCFVQSDNCSYYHTFRNISKFTDICKWCALWIRKESTIRLDEVIIKDIPKPCNETA